MGTRIFFAAAVAGGLTLVAAGCGGDKNGGLTAPSSPSQASTSSSPAAKEASSAPASASLGAASGARLSSLVTFPPRNEPFAFGNDLNGLYQKTLRRGPVSTFVDLEGYIVWIQEYLRYRVNGCSHTDAMARVFKQIGGFGVSPVCGEAPAGPVDFPPRDQPVDFGNQLNAYYRDNLRQGQVSTFVDLEGWIVWLQEYLRYRVNGCDHTTAEFRVFTQITGGGMQPVCSVPPPSNNSFTGTVGPHAALAYNIDMLANGRFQATLTWSDPSIDLDLYLATTGCSSYPPTSCLVTVSKSAGTVTETVSWTVRAGETYRLWIDNFSNRSTPFTVTHGTLAAGTRESEIQAIPGGPEVYEGAVGKSKQ